MRGVLDGIDAVEGLQAVVIDADALNALSEIPDWHEGLSVPRVLTPHPGEMARLLGASVEEVQADRLSHATQYAQRTGSVVVLKGAGTIVAHPDGRARLSEFASAVLATAGTGDVLAGFIVSLIAQGMDPYDAAATGGLPAHRVRSPAGDGGRRLDGESRRICCARCPIRARRSTASCTILTRPHVMRLTGQRRVTSTMSKIRVDAVAA